MDGINWHYASFHGFTKSRAANLAPVGSVHDFKRLIFIYMRKGSEREREREIKSTAYEMSSISTDIASLMITEI